MPTGKATGYGCNAYTYSYFAYKVQSGDTLSSIAEYFYGNVNMWKAVCNFNDLNDCQVIAVGEWIALPWQAADYTTGNYQALNCSLTVAETKVLAANVGNGSSEYWISGCGSYCADFPCDCCTDSSCLT